MHGRFILHDLVQQDAGGVTYRAIDRETDRAVELRRFFPFGASGRGLSPSEHGTFDTVVGRLVDADLPTLRRVVAGGIDPIDRMPFLVTEWLDGPSLAEVLVDGPLDPDWTRYLLALALEASQQLSQILDHPGLWLEVAPPSIGFHDDLEERPVTFRLAPLAGLGTDGSPPDLQALRTLAEVALGWDGRMVADAAAAGLGGWVKALRRDPRGWSLEQAKQALDATAAEAPGPVVATAPPTWTPVASALAAPRRGAWRPALAALALIAVAGLWYLWMRYPPGRATAPTTAATVANAAPAPPSATGTTDGQRDGAIETITVPGTAGPGVAVAAETSGVSPDPSRPSFEEVHGEEVVATGPLDWVNISGSGKTLYLKLGDPAWAGEVIARYHTRREIFTEHELRSLVNQPLRISGKVVKDPRGCFAIDIADPTALEILETSE